MTTVILTLALVRIPPERLEALVVLRLLTLLSLLIGLVDVVVLLSKRILTRLGLTIV